MADADPSLGNRGSHRLVFLGAPGSGKGTQAQILAAHLEIPAISTGDMLRAAKAAGTPLGQRVGEIMQAGKLVDDDTMADVVRDRLAQDDAEDGFILDGYPRTAVQVDTLADILKDAESDLDAVLTLHVDEEELVQRALARNREDDTEEIIRERLAVYHRETEPLVAHYREAGKLIEVDGMGTVDEVARRLTEALAR